jgi:hypothetical protein
MMKRISADALAGPDQRLSSSKLRHAGRSNVQLSGDGVSLIFSLNSAPPTSPHFGQRLSLMTPKPADQIPEHPLPI